MKCHYEILEISRDANDSEIKSAYRKQALQWHPDKNLNNPDFAKEQFQLVQQAYEILSDKQERAWYDAHRDQMLRGANSGFQDESLDVFQYFTTTCFEGFGDDENGFYTVYRNVFSQIVKEDMDSIIDEKEEFIKIPEFGVSDSDYEEVNCFYDFWMSYSTKKSFSWLEPHDIREGKGNRRVLKIIEKENKKVRQKFRKERNEEVRNLVAFVRKRDRRVQAYKKDMEERNIGNRKKQEALSKQKRLERNRQHASEMQGDWMKFDHVKSQLEEMEKHLAQEFGEELSNSEEEMEESNNLYCIACNKVFKNPKAFKNHESSKKHKENVDKLKQIMLEDDLQSNLTDNLDNYSDNEVDKLSSENEPVSEEESEKEEGTSEETGKNSVESSEKLKKKKNKFVLNIDEELDLGTVDGLDASDDDFDFGTSKHQRKKNRRNNVNKLKPSTSNVDNINIETVEQDTSLKGKKKDRKKSKDSLINETVYVDTSHCCVTCRGNFPSKNKLFDHLKKTGHGVYLPTKIKQNNKNIVQKK